MKYFIEKFYNMGFNILAIDLRTHGESEEKKRIKEERRIWFESYQKDVYTISNDNLKLHAHLINNNSNVYVIIVHPYEGRGSYMKYLRQRLIYEIFYRKIL